MNYGPLVFLSAFFALAASWYGFVLTPQLQVGRLQQTNTVPPSTSYPLARPGLAQQGLQVYRANGCFYCHSQQVGQSGTVCDVVLFEVGTNREAVVSALSKVANVSGALSDLPKSVLSSVTRERANALVKALTDAGARAQLWIVPVGADIKRGWGKRRSVAEDFLFDSPVMLGSQRIGPDLANIGVRRPDPNWHLRHLFDPAHEVAGSTMPPYRFLFQKRRIQRAPSAEALILSGRSPAEPGYEIVPTAEANALAAYLVSLRADASLFVAPLTMPAPAAADTNAPAGTNAPAPIPTAPK
jgi:cbb3-type cytochrome oxidase cytochrome c subunit